jgi:rod shape-determining protein MreD
LRKEVVLELLAEIGYLALAFVLQASVVGYLSIGEMKPDLILGALVYVAISRKPVHSTVAGFLVGVFQDLSFGGWLGLNALSKCIVAFSVSTLSRKVFKERYWTQLVLLFLAVLAHDAIYFIGLYPRSISSIGLAIIRVPLGSAVLTAAISPAYDFVIRRIFSLKGPVSREPAALPREQ